MCEHVHSVWSLVTSLLYSSTTVTGLRGVGDKLSCSLGDGSASAPASEVRRRISLLLFLLSQRSHVGDVIAVGVSDRVRVALHGASWGSWLDDVGDGERHKLADGLQEDGPLRVKS